MAFVYGMMICAQIVLTTALYKGLDFFGECCTIDVQCELQQKSHSLLSELTLKSERQKRMTRAGIEDALNLYCGLILSLCS